MPTRILHIVTYMGRGGLETLLMNSFRHIDREKIQFDFLVHRDFRADYDDEIEALGGRIFRLPRLNPFSPAYRNAVNLFFTQHPEYRIVHCHLDCMSAIPLAAAKKARIPVRIAHSHNSNQDKNLKYLLKRYYMHKIPAVATHFFACSQAAGEWMFPGQNVTVVNNGIETGKFAYSPAIRAQVRQELGIRSELVLGHVGRFMPQKNHHFLIDIFAEVHKRDPKAKLLLMGEGPLEQQVQEKVHSLGLDHDVRFLGVRADVNRILQAMDVFVLPSLYEGLGMVAVEAQTSGMFCVLSSAVPSVCKMTGNVTFVPLEDPPAVWAEQIIAGASRKRVDQRTAITAAGYDIQTTADYLQSFYLENSEHE